MQFTTYQRWLRGDNINEAENELDFIFTGAVWSSREDGQMQLRLLPDGTVYGRGEDFDFERDSKEAALTQLKKWGYHYIGAE